MPEEFVATFPCYVMVAPELEFNSATHAMRLAKSAEWIIKIEGDEQFLLAFTDLDRCSEFVSEIPDAPRYALIPVDADFLAHILANIKRRSGSTVHVKFDTRKSFSGFVVDFDQIVSGGRDDVRDPEE